MQITTRSLVAVAVLFVLFASTAAPAFAAITMQGNVPTGRAGLVIIPVNKQLKGTGVLKFKFSAPAPKPGGYALSFCVGPASNPCGMANSFVVNVPASEERIVLIDASVFATNVLTVGQGTSTPVPFAVEIE